MIRATIRLYETGGQWQIYELAVFDGLGTSQHVCRAPQTYASEEEAVLMAKYEARVRIVETWGFAAVDHVDWDIKTIVEPHELEYPSCLVDRLDSLS